jgi:phosphoribosylformylglycinamidine synthase subunit PurSL
MIRHIYRIEVSPRPGVFDGRAEGLVASAASLGIRGLRQAAVSDLYFVRGVLSPTGVERLCRELLADPVSQTYRWESWRAPRPAGTDSAVANPISGSFAIEVTFRPGVTDTVAASILAGATIVGIKGVEAAATGRRYVFQGELSDVAISSQVERLARGMLCNDLIQVFSLGNAQPPLLAPTTTPQDASDRVETVPLLQADDFVLEEINRARLLSLNLSEMRAIQSYFRREGREPDDVEMETIAQTWSEHCGHKTFRGIVDYEEHVGDEVRHERIDGLLKTYLRRATERLDKPWVRSAFVDNAGILDFEDGYEISFKVETHNHPSALEPFGGANTGVGGVIRDIIGVSARPIANTDVLCFGEQARAFEDLPPGVLHPQRVFDGVVAGVEDYGNKMGIPTVGGAILYDAGYETNPLVFCGCLGLAPTGLHRSEPIAGDRIVLIGGRTGRDGLRGATFSSAELTQLTAEESGSAVQIGNPVIEKKSLEAIIQARDAGLYTAITDCGGGGLSSAVGEMGKELGVTVQLERVPLKYAGLRPWEIWLSEAQERMVLAVRPENVDGVIDICTRLDVEATDIGELTGDGRLRLRFGDTTVANMSMEFLHNGIPQRHLKGIWTHRPDGVSDHPAHLAGDLTDDLRRILSQPNIASKEAVIRRYDHEVQGATVIKPLVGVRHHGPSDAAVLKPFLARHTVRAASAGRASDNPAQAAGLSVPSWKGIVLSHGINPGYSALDPYLMAHAAIDEAVRNAVCVGADPDHLAILDNFCWGNPDLPDRMGDLVRACKGCYEASLAFGVPFISGKDSLNNEYFDSRTGHKISIPPTLLISAVAIMPDIRRAVTMDLKQAGDYVYAVGQTRDELGGSAYYRLLGATGEHAPQPAANGPGIAGALHRAIMDGRVRACHDCSEGGWAVAGAEMALAGELGLELSLSEAPGGVFLPDDATRCFSESNSRYLVEVKPKDADAFEEWLSGLPVARVGFVTSPPVFVVRGAGEREVIRAEVSELESAWRGLAARDVALAGGAE